MQPGPREVVRVGSENADLLSYWCRQVQRKVDRIWQVPTGIPADGSEAEVGFWVYRDGTLADTPQIIKHATSPAVGESGVRAVQLAAPFGPLPENYPEPELWVIYAFKVSE